jgi:hypothetical protein
MAEFKAIRRQTGIQKKQHWPKEKKEEDKDFPGTNLLQI